MNELIHIKKDSVHRIVIEKSEFITYLHKTYSEYDAKAFIAEIRKKHYDATHVCTAYYINENTQKSNDDGEPKGTAGIPMLETIKKTGVSNLLACTVRYFGGIKLGGGGLIRAYSSSVSEALNNTPKVKLVPYNIYKIIIPYSLSNKVEYHLNNSIINKEYELEVIFTFISNNKNIIKELEELTNGKYLPEFIENRLIEIEFSG